MFNIIYRLINVVNGKYYIGQTWRSLKDRWNGGRGYDQCPYMNSAVKKHGKDNFEYEILTVCSSQETADYWEDFFIAKFDSQNPNKGYNLKEGGAYGKQSEETKKKISDSNKGRVMSEEAKQKISNANRGRVFSEERNRKISLAKLGKLGPKHTEETKVKISQILTGRILSEEHIQKIVRRTTGVKASKETKNKMSLAQKGKPKSEETKRKMSEASKGKPKSAKHREVMKGKAPSNKGKTRFTENQILAMKAMRDDGMSFPEIAEVFDAERHTISKLVKRS